MDTKHQLILAGDAIVNLLLGIILLLFPAGIIDLLGLPQTNTFFYPSILGGVLFGIGLALGIEYFFYRTTRGLGLSGAIAINFSGGLVLLFWLLFSKPEIPFRGIILLWAVAILVIGIGVFEVTTISRFSVISTQEENKEK